MTILAPSTIPLINDRLRMVGTVTLSAEVATELLSRAASSYSMEIVLSQIATGDGREAAWAKRTLTDLERARPKLRYPSRLVKFEVA
jgi:hypothetical protein